MNPRAMWVLLLAGCVPAETPKVAVDQCVLKEYVQDCDSELATPEEQLACRRKAPQESMRILAGIPAECRS